MENTKDTQVRGYQMQQNKLKIIRRNYKLKVGDIVCIDHFLTNKGQHTTHHIGIVTYVSTLGRGNWYNIRINNQYSRHDNTAFINTKDTMVVKLRKL